MSDNRFNIQVRELDESSPIMDVVKPTKIKLKLHQKTLLYACHQFENSNIDLSDANSNIHITTRVGIIGDKVGSGKSYVILSLVLNDDMTKLEHPMLVTKTYADNNIVVSTVENKHIINVNVLVIPHNLIQQWSNYIQAFSNNIRTLFVTKSSHYVSLRNTNFESYDLIVISSTFYNRVASFMNEENITVRRVFYDEVDNINIPSCEKISSYFYWFITASYGNLLYPRGYNGYDASQRKYIMYATGIRSSGFVKNMLQSMTSTTEAAQISRILVIKNTEEFITASLHLPQPIVNKVKCKTPHSINILSGLVDKHILDCLHANDIASAMEYLSPHNKQTEENIVSLMMEKFKKQIRNINLEIEHVNHLEFDTDEQRIHRLAMWHKKKEDAERQMNAIQARIRECNACCICYDDICNKSIVPCCSSSFCFKCISVWLTSTKTCPLCRKFITTADLLVVQNSNIANAADDNTCNAPVELDKLQNLEAILASRKPDSKFLIFSSYENSFENIVNILRNMHISFAFLKGTSSHVNNIVNRYKNEDLQVLLVNTRNYGSGLNLENTTDVIMFHKFDSEIEKQVIGRAQRYGRNDPLNIWYLLYASESFET